VMCVPVDGAFLHQVPKSALTKSVEVTEREVPPELIHGDLEDEARLGFLGSAHGRH